MSRKSKPAPAKPPVEPELETVPFSKVFKRLLDELTQEYNRKVTEAANDEAAEKGFPQGTQFDIRTLCWHYPKPNVPAAEPKPVLVKDEPKPVDSSKTE